MCTGHVCCRSAWQETDAGSDIDEYTFVLPGRVDCFVWLLPAWLLPAWLDPDAGSDIDEYTFVLPGWVDCVVWSLPAEPVGSDLHFFVFVLLGRWPESASLF